MSTNTVVISKMPVALTQEQRKLVAEFFSVYSANHGGTSQVVSWVVELAKCMQIVEKFKNLSGEQKAQLVKWIIKDIFGENVTNEEIDANIELIMDASNGNFDINKAKKSCWACLSCCCNFGLTKLIEVSIEIEREGGNLNIGNIAGHMVKDIVENVENGTEQKMEEVKERIIEMANDKTKPEQKIEQ